MADGLLGWHFTNGMTLRDGQPLVVGQTYRVDGPLELCRRGLHASERAIDALKYAPGAMVSRVRLGGQIVTGDDKACATERTVLWCADATTILRQFAIACGTNALAHAAARGYKTDRRSHEALRVATAYLKGAASRAELQAAQREAWAARSDLYAAAYAAAAYADAYAYAYAADAAAYADADAYAYAAAAAADAAAAAYADAYAYAAAAAAAAAYAAAAARRAMRDSQNAMLETMLLSLEPAR